MHTTPFGSLARRVGACAAVLIVGTSAGRQPSVVTRQAPNGRRDAVGLAEDGTLWVEMRNVNLHIDSQNVMRVRSLRGEVVPAARGSIAWLDQATSFCIRATGGEVALDGRAITALLNEIVFNYPAAPLRHLRVRIEKGAIVQNGTLHKGVDIPFEMWSVPELLTDGRLRLHPQRLRIFSVDGLKLMHALGLHLSSMMDLSKSHGASVKGDDIFLDPLEMIPPPAVVGRLASVRVENDVLVQEFVRTADDSIFGTVVRPDSDAHNFIYFRGGQLRFGRLTMDDTDLLIRDADESDPFDLYLAEYNRQLVAGHTKNLPDYGLRTWMVDYDKLGASARTRLGRRSGDGSGT
jgi:hypothetical protein